MNFCALPLGAGQGGGPRRGLIFPLQVEVFLQQSACLFHAVTRIIRGLVVGRPDAGIMGRSCHGTVIRRILFRLLKTLGP
jgi:hypothetical protein